MKEDSILKPSLFTEFPLDSIHKKRETEQVALNIMRILKRNGDKFLFPEEMTWQEYKQERLKDGGFSDSEQPYFEKVKHLSMGLKSTIISFSPVWNKSFIEAVQSAMCSMYVEKNDPKA